MNNFTKQRNEIKKKTFISFLYSLKKIQFIFRYYQVINLTDKFVLIFFYF